MDEKKPTRKPTLPPGMTPKAKKPTGPPSAKKPAGPPSAKKPTLPPGRKPSLPPGKAPTRPPGAKPSGPPVGRVIGGDGATDLPTLTKQDFTSDQDVRWCPGCGDYSILAQTQRIMPELGVPKENVVFISGIGCSSRFPYYMETYGMHTIHGRAPAVATGIKASRPELDVWIVTGDGDALSIGGNHLIHIMRRNVDVQILLFNNQIYGLTKGQYSPTSEVGKVTKSTPFGSIDHPFNPIAVALGADASFVARTMDRDPKHLRDTLKTAHGHRGTSFVEIYQNCNIFNDGAFFEFTEKDTKATRTLFVEDGKPMTFAKHTRGIRLVGAKLEIIDLTNGAFSVDDCLVHDESSPFVAQLLSQMSWQADMPRPFGVFYREKRPTYDAELQAQMDRVKDLRGAGDIKALLHAGDTWTVS